MFGLTTEFSTSKEVAMPNALISANRNNPKSTTPLDLVLS